MKFDESLATRVTLIAVVAIYATSFFLPACYERDDSYRILNGFQAYWFAMFAIAAVVNEDRIFVLTSTAWAANPVFCGSLWYFARRRFRPAALLAAIALTLSAVDGSVGSSGLRTSTSTVPNLLTGLKCFCN